LNSSKLQALNPPLTNTVTQNLHEVETQVNVVAVVLMVSRLKITKKKRASLKTEHNKPVLNLLVKCSENGIGMVTRVFLFYEQKRVFFFATIE